MKKLLEKISWSTRKWNYKFSLLNVNLHDHEGSWGLSICTFSVNFQTYSLFSIEIRLPNRTHVQRLVVDDWDFLFLSRPIYRKYDKLVDAEIYGASLSIWDLIFIQLCKKLF